MSKSKGNEAVPTAAASASSHPEGNGVGEAPVSATSLRIVFAVLSVASVFVWRRYRSRHPETSDHPILNQRGRNYVGRRFTLASPIVDGVGKLHVDDTSWKISGANLPAGSHVKVVGVEGTMLKVEAVEDTP